MSRTYRKEEKEIQKSISNYLWALKIIHTITDASAIPMGDGTYRASEKVDPAWPDLTGFIPRSVSPLLVGRGLLVEVKTKTGKLRPARLVKRGFRRVLIPSQADVLRDLRKAGVVAIVARSIDDVKDALRIAEQCVRDDIDFVVGLPELK